MKLQAIVAAALVLTTKGKYETLGGSSVVGIIDPDNPVWKPSPIDESEIMIGYVNLKGKFVPGWIAKKTKFRDPIAGKKAKPETFIPDDDTKLHPWDAVRLQLKGQAYAKQDLAWFTKRRGLLERVVREFGSKWSSTSVPDLARKVGALTGAINAPQLEEKPVKKNRKQRQDEEQDAPKAKAKKASKENGAPARLFSRTVGNNIALICALAGTSTPKAAKQLANDEQLSKKALIGLRDGVNEITRELRQGNRTQQVCALALAHANMGVQRLSRSGK